MESKNGIIQNMVVEKAKNKTVEEDVSRGKENFQSRFQSTLIARKEEVEKALGLLIESQKEHKKSFSGADFIEYFDQAERDISANKYYTLLERKSSELKKIEFLIKRVLKEEEFGLCEECGEKIPEERLFVIPEATLCVPCQRDLEKMDSRRSLAERTYVSLGKKKGLQWESSEDFGGKVGFTIDTDRDNVSVIDFEETDLEGTPKEKMK